MKFYTETSEEVLKSVNSSENGLSSAEAEKRLEENGKNKLKEAKKDSLLKRFLKQLADPMIIILLIAAGISAVTAVIEGGEGFVDVFIILFVVIMNAVL
ncbi:MAG: ATPase, partial [Clostridia bacterium]|nr:ATPase [Clostridia bacterium]